MPRRLRWPVLLAVMVVALNLRIVVAAVSPVLDQIRADVPFSPGAAGLLGTVPVVTFALSGAIAPTLAHRWGVERVLVIAMLVTAAGQGLRSTSTTSAAFIGWTVLALAGMGLGNVLLPAVVKRWYPDRTAVVTGAYAVALATSASLPPLVVRGMADQLGWRPALATWALLGLLGAASFGLVILHPRIASTDVAVPGVHPLRWSVMVHSRRAWAMAVLFGTNSMNAYVQFAWLPQMLVDRGVTPESAARWLAFVAALVAPAALLAPVIATRIRNPSWYVIGCVAAMVVGYTGIVWWDGPIGLWAILAGIGPAPFPLILILVSQRTRGHAATAGLSGYAQGIGYGIAAVGPVGIGLIYQHTGTWQVPVFCLWAVAAVMAAAGWFAGRPGILEDELADRLPESHHEAQPATGSLAG